MKEKKRINPKRVLTRLIVICIGFFALGGIIGYNAGKTAAEAKIEPITPIVEEQTQLEPLDQQPKQEEEQLIDIGKFTLSAYCSCVDCCGKNDGITATGAKVQQGVTVAVDPSIIPYGTTIVINGDEYIAQDTLARHIIDRYNGRIIDVYFDSHAEALQFGLQTAEVYVKN